MFECEHKTVRHMPKYIGQTVEKRVSFYNQKEKLMHFWTWPFIFVEQFICHI